MTINLIPCYLATGTDKLYSNHVVHVVDDDDDDEDEDEDEAEEEEEEED
jgi:hypothetical protein